MRGERTRQQIDAELTNPAEGLTRRLVQQEHGALRTGPQGFEHRSAAAATAGSVAALARQAGNRAVSHYLTLQRCGDVPASQCPCHDPSTEDHAVAIQRSPGLPPTPRAAWPSDRL